MAFVRLAGDFGFLPQDGDTTATTTKRSVSSSSSLELIALLEDVLEAQKQGAFLRSKLVHLELSAQDPSFYHPPQLSLLISKVSDLEQHFSLIIRDCKIIQSQLQYVEQYDTEKQFLSIQPQHKRDLCDLFSNIKNSYLTEDIQKALFQWVKDFDPSSLAEIEKVSSLISRALAQSEIVRKQLVSIQTHQIP